MRKFLDVHFSNEEARDLLQEVLFRQGDRRSGLYGLTQKLAGEDRARLGRELSSLRQLLAEAEKLKQEGKYRQAEKSFQQFLERLDRLQLQERARSFSPSP